ncbi:hypothetical protein OBBRIDRAFT_70745 [Obba rivulosa]|uniref:Uncharacterized protein n=1 Tax=Obba rivulosa TaxID=1052685 RepID=A0A8E2DK96_9APHY|nr:hypothetical protein OBBRIDRAFT_70745 [Obba rivulosa]
MRHASLLTIILLVGVYVGAQSNECSDGLSVLNNQQGQTPCNVSSEVLKPCQSGFYPVSHCACNLIAYNLASACNVCTNTNATTTWPNWLQHNSCPSNATDPSPSLPDDYGLQGVSIPGWAKAKLTSDHDFNLPAALIIASDRSWSRIQIIVPVVVGVSVALLAAGIFLFYRLRRRRSWRARLPFGAKRVRRRSHRKDPDWEIENDVAQEVQMGSLSGASERAQLSHQDDDDDDGERPRISHNRSGSASSLLSMLPLPGPRHAAPNPISTFFGRLTRYKSGFRKSPEYRAAQVRPRDIDRRWVIEGSAPPTRAATFETAVEPPGTEATRPQGLQKGANGVNAAHGVELAEEEPEEGEESVLLISRNPGEDFTLLDSDLGASPVTSTATHTLEGGISTPPRENATLSPSGSPRAPRRLDPWQSSPLPSIPSVSPLTLPPSRHWP